MECVLDLSEETGEVKGVEEEVGRATSSGESTEKKTECERVRVPPTHTLPTHTRRGTHTSHTSSHGVVREFGESREKERREDTGRDKEHFSLTW